MSFEDEVRKASFKGIITGAIISAFGFLVALQWNTALIETINTLFPQNDSLFYKYLLAIAITIIASIGAYILVRLQKRTLINIKTLSKHLKDSKI